MKKRFHSHLVLLLIACLAGGPFACNRPSVTTPANYKGRQLMVGSGGGITGFYRTYYLLENRKVFFQNSRDTAFTFVGKQTKADTKRAFKTAEEDCAIKTVTFDHPGNTYKFIQWKEGEESHKVTWGETGKTVPPGYPSLYTMLMTMVPDSVKPN